MLPAAELPLYNNELVQKRTKLKRQSALKSRLVIINLQKTKLDQFATVVLHAKADVVMDVVCQKLKIPLNTITDEDRSMCVKKNPNSVLKIVSRLVYVSH